MSADVAKVVDLLSAATRPASEADTQGYVLDILHHDAAFVGEISGEHFELRRFVTYPPSSTMPHLFGTLRASNTGTIINVTVCLTGKLRLTFGGFAIGLALLILACLALCVAGEVSLVAIAPPVTLIGLLFANVWVGCRIEANEGQRILERICRAA
jgi:hypothetical protein